LSAKNKFLRPKHAKAYGISNKKLIFDLAGNCLC